MKDDNKAFALSDELLEQVSGGDGGEVYFFAAFTCPECNQRHEFKFKCTLNPTPEDKNICSRIASCGYIWPEAKILNYVNVNNDYRQASFILLGAECNGQFYPAPQ